MENHPTYHPNPLDKITRIRDNGRMKTAGVTHSPDCDGYGYLHHIQPRRVFENGGYMWVGECVCGYRTGYAGSPETVKYLGREHRGADVCTGQCMS